MRIVLSLLTIVVLGTSMQAEELRQTIRGSVKDAYSEEALEGANIKIHGANASMQAVSDTSGSYKFSDVPIGRYDITCTYQGYESITFYQIDLTASKELIIHFKLYEKVTQTDVVVIKANKDKRNTINNTISISGRTFSVEESMRYAGSKSDVARMAQSFAGVQGSDDSRNDIVVRGNSPMGVLYRLEGVDIPNPNHYSSSGTTGGPISMLNTNVLRNSDFISGAFPAEYGNATAAVFDLGMRNGNDEKFEFLGQVAFAGFEGLAEGPIFKKNKSSFIFDYRYSALGFFNLIGVDFGTGTAIPKYQDLNFKAHFPDKKGSFSLFGLAGTSRIELFQSNDAGENLFRTDPEDLYYQTSTGVVGLARKQRLGSNGLLNITVATDGARTITHLDTFQFAKDQIINRSGKYRNDSKQGKVSFIAEYQKKINAKNSLKTGSRFYLYKFNLEDSFYSSKFSRWVKPTDFTGQTGLSQSFVNLQHRFNSRLNLNLGLNYVFFTFNNSQSFEPRFGFKYKLHPKVSLNAGYGLHSQLVPFRAYYQEFRDSLGNSYTANQDLGLNRSHHFIVGSDISFGQNTRLKIELYYQALFDVPIDGGDQVYFSLLNQGTDFTLQFTDNMVNDGSGRNYGIEFTLEHFLSKGFYYLNTLSLYRSFFTDQLGNEHPTAYDSRFALNLLGGKEYYFKAKEDKKGRIKKASMTTDFRLMVNGGKRYTPIDQKASEQKDEIVYELHNLFQNQYKNYFRIDFRVGFKVQGKKYSQEWGMDIQNLTNYKNIFQRTYNLKSNQYETFYQTGILPVGIYRITF